MGLRLRLVLALLTLAWACRSNAQRWERLGPEGGIVISLGAGSEGTVYLGTADGHVFASEDSAARWELRGRVGSRLDAVVTRLVVDSEDANVVFAAVWYREAAENGAVFRSVDGGRSWKLSGLQGEAVRALEAAPSNHRELVAGTRTGVFRSQDQGATWQRISPEGDAELRNVDSVAIDPRDAKVIYAGTYHLPWRTKDGGKRWEPIVAGIIDDSDIMSLRLDSTDPDRLYLSACSGIYRSEDRGAQWTKLQGIPYAARRTHTIVQDVQNPKVFYAGTTEGAWVTRDSGETWTRTTPREWVVNSIVVLPAGFKNGGRVVMGTESGIHISDDNGRTFSVSNTGFKHVVIKQFLAGYQGSGRLLALAQRNGWELLESTDGGRNWTTVSLETGKAALVPDQIEETYGSPWGWLVRMADGKLWLRNERTQVWSEFRPRERAAAQRIRRSREPKGNRPAVPLQIGPVLAFTEDAAVVSSGQGVLRCGESGACEALKAFPGTGTAAAMWASKSGEIAVVQSGKLGYSGDRGGTAVWRDLPVPQPEVLWLAGSESPAAARFLLGTAAGLFVSADGGVNWRGAKNGIPSGRIETWAGGPEFWVVSERSGGLYVSRDRGVNWSRVDEDAERGRFAGLVYVGSGAVLAGSQAEGLLLLSDGVK